MIEIGKRANLKVEKAVEFGVYLDGEDLGEILLPENYLPKDCKVGDNVDVFIYLDSEDRIIATTETPFAEVADFALLKVVDIAQVGAFLNWGLSKDLFVPFREQKDQMIKGKSYVVFIYIDNSDRIAASSRVERFLDKDIALYQGGEEVELLIYEETEIGYKAIIDSSFQGVLYRNEVFQPLKIGEKLRGFIKKVREDGKIDLILQKPGPAQVDELSQKILTALEKDGGFIAVTDKSSPKVISGFFGCSKNAYKRAIGGLYKKRLITLEKSGIKLCEKSG